MRVLVIGGGVAGEHFVGALRRLDGDAEIVLVESGLVGGECSYWACMPTKTMLRPLEALAAARAAPGAAEAVTGDADAARVAWWREEVVDHRDDSSQEAWLGEQGAQLVRGRAELVEPGLVRVGDRELPYDRLVVATGSRPALPALDGLADVPYWTNREATEAVDVPASLVVLGAGAVGCELAQYFARLGSRVVVLQSADRLLPRTDPAAGELLLDVFREEGIDVRLDARVDAVERANGGVRARLAGGAAVEAERLLVATGRRPNAEGLGLERVDATVTELGVRVDDRLRAADGVWAVGDVTGVSLFTHVGKYQARVAAANVAGGDARADYRAIPAAIFTDPQIAAVGRTEGDGLRTATWSLGSTPRAATYARPRPRGFLKLAVDRERGVVAGALAAGPEAGEWMQQLTLAVRAEVPADVLLDTIQPYPTFSEAVFFAARELAG